MAEQQLIDYIKKARSSGQADNKSKTLLMENGWSDQEVDSALLFLNQPVQQPSLKTGAEKINSRGGGRKILIGSLAGLLVVVFLGGAGYSVVKYDLINKFLKTETPVVKNEAENLPSVQSFSAPVFSVFKLEKTIFNPSLPNYTISLEDLPNLPDFEKAQKYNFSQDQKNALLQNNFVIVKNDTKFYSDNKDGFTMRNDDWTGLYKTLGGGYSASERMPENSVFITSDFLLHVYHKLIDQEFTYIEESNFYPTLAELSKFLLSSASKSYQQEQTQEQKDSYERLSAYFLVTSAILESASADYAEFKRQNFITDTKNDSKEAVLALVDSLSATHNISESAKGIAKQELELIFESKNITSSPLLGRFQGGEFLEDYTQFTPRSHYTKNAVLRTYFRAMMFYGRMNFLLKSPELTRDAANITLLMSEEQEKQWESIYQPTTFFVGKSDDLSVYEYKEAQKTTGASRTNESITKLQNELLSYKNPQIMSSAIFSESVVTSTKEDLQKTTKGFRFMGQRFTPDAFIFSTLTQGDELPDKETGQKLPSTPTALMVSSLMGSKESANLLETWIKENAPDSDKVIENRMNTLRGYFDKTTEQQWTQNIYWSWLNTIKSLFSNADTTGYPVFMRSASWQRKDLQSFLGSWTELKHDTLLYAKQSYAELGAGGPEDLPANPIPKGYVEPNIKFFDNLIALVNFTTDGLKKFNLLPPNLEARNNTFKENLKFYREIAVAELQNEKISDDDFEKLRLSAGNLDSILYPPEASEKLEKNARSAIIADVHTDIVTGKILYEANGIPNYIYVAVKDANGTRLTKGLVYSYYEFTDLIDKRLTDEKWQSINYSKSSKNLVMPWWNKELVK